MTTTTTPVVIVPTVGRVVWFHPAAAANPNGQPHAALIAFVQSEQLVNLAVFDENGTGYSATSVPLLQGDDAPPADGSAYAEWMPFQKGQAAKTEAVLAASPLSLVTHGNIADIPGFGASSTGQS